MTPEYLSNGLNGATGSYLAAPSTDYLAQVARGTAFTPDHLSGLEQKSEQSQARTKKGITRGKDPKKLDEAGWGVIFAAPDPNQASNDLSVAAIKDALRPLLDRRKAQATLKKPHYYREFFGTKPDRGFRPTDTKRSFLRDNGIANSIGVADPETLPYYLLIVGDPATIPFSVQYELGVAYAVGRIAFDTLEQYRHYAQTVVSVEQQASPPSRKATFFAVRNPDDDATRASADRLIPPIITHLQDIHSTPWSINTTLNTDADKAQLQSLLGGPETPDFLFTASHGIAFPKDHALHRRHQGALVCQDWPGPHQWGQRPIPPDFYFSADDLSPDANLNGLIAFHFACYGAGIPTTDNFYRQTKPSITDPTPTRIADQEFIAPLPQRLLGHANGGALAVIGHIDRLWTRSFQSQDGLPRLDVFKSALSSILDGDPIGLAMEFFNQRYGVCATELHQLIDEKSDDDITLASTWLDTNDARNYIILGDPAVKIGPRPAPVDPEPSVLPLAKTEPETLDDLRRTVRILERRIETLERQMASLQQPENQSF